jgi:hypothetical protein
MIDHHCPAVDADGHLRHPLVVGRDDGQPLQPPAQVVAEVTNRTTGERQLARGVVERTELMAHERERILGRDEGTGAAADLGHAAARHQRGAGGGRENVVARAARFVPPAVEEYRPRLVGQALEQHGRIRKVG